MAVETDFSQDGKKLTIKVKGASILASIRNSVMPTSAKRTSPTR